MRSQSRPTLENGMLSFKDMHLMHELRTWGKFNLMPLNNVRSKLLAEISTKVIVIWILFFFSSDFFQRLFTQIKKMLQETGKGNAFLVAFIYWLHVVKYLIKNIFHCVHVCSMCVFLRRSRLSTCRQVLPGALGACGHESLCFGWQRSFCSWWIHQNNADW